MDESMHHIAIVTQTQEELGPLHFVLRGAVLNLQALNGQCLLVFREKFGLSRAIWKKEKDDG